jgi:quercetin dioxygenase-like cupin family protein
MAMKIGQVFARSKQPVSQPWIEDKSMPRTVVKTNNVTSHPSRGRMLPAAILLTFLLIKPVTMAQHGSNRGLATPTSRVKWEQDSDVRCLTSALENGDPNTGASTFILKATPDCIVPWHYHTAEEQLIVVHGHLVAEMESMTATPLEDGGFAPSKVKHQFSCRSRDGCLLFVTFDRAYDISWVSQKK